MLIIDIAKPGSEIYAEVSGFARDVYLEKFGAVITASPTVFAYAKYEGRVVGCLGLYRPFGTEPVLIERYIPDAFQKISTLKDVDRGLCAELGTRVVVDVPNISSVDVSIALAAFLIIYAKARNISYLGFTSNRSVAKVVRGLGIDLLTVGEPDIEDFDQEFKENWKRFFEVKQICFGMRIDSNSACFGCFAALSKLEPQGIKTRIQSLFES